MTASRKETEYTWAFSILSNRIHVSRKGYIVGNEGWDGNLISCAF